MKAFALLMFLLAATTASFSQANETLLTTDSIFDRAALKELRFPVEVYREEKSIRLFVRFTLTPEGEYDDVAIVNPEAVNASFKEELNRFWRKLPRQDPRYVGHYVVPISFLFSENGSDNVKPLSNEKDTPAVMQGYRILSELPLVGYVLCEKKSFVE